MLRGNWSRGISGFDEDRATATLNKRKMISNVFMSYVSAHSGVDSYGTKGTCPPIIYEGGRPW